MAGHNRKVLWLGVLLLICASAYGHAQEPVRAKLGIHINSNGAVRLAAATDPVKAGDILRVRVVPLADAYVYVVHSDGKQVVLLNATSIHTRVSAGTNVELPEDNKWYQIDGQSSAEYITVICSPQEIPHVVQFFKNPAGASRQQWAVIEKELLEKSKISLGQKVAIGQSAGPTRDFIPTFTGKSLVAKKYALQVQK